MNEWGKKDQNSVTTLMGITDDANQYIRNLRVDPTTGRLLVTGTGSGGSPLTTKGDLYGHSTVDARIPVGSNGQVLSADSTQTLGVNWITPSSGTPRVSQITSSATPSVNSDNFDVLEITALATGATIAAPTGTPSNFQKLKYCIKDNGSSQTLAWDATFAPFGITFPLATVVSKLVEVQFEWHSTDSLWYGVAIASQA